MLLLLALISAALVYTLVGLVFEWGWGLPSTKGGIEREFDRITASASADPTPKWRVVLTNFVRPPEAGESSLARPLLVVALSGFAVGWGIFGSWVIGLVMTTALIPFRHYLVQNLRRKRRDTLNLQFKDALVSIATSIRAGASLRTAVERALSDMRRILHGQPQQPMVEELERITKEISLGGSVEEALLRFRDRAGLEDVTNFVNAALLCKSRGGNLAEVMTTIAQVIGDKVTVRQQVQVLTAGKRMEALVLTGVPPAMVGTLALMSPEYLKPLFTTLLGQLLALLGVILLVSAYFIGRKIVDIEV